MNHMTQWKWLLVAGNYHLIDEAKRFCIDRLNAMKTTILRIVIVNELNQVVRIVASYEDPEAV
jgi:hypothetical protein